MQPIPADKLIEIPSVSGYYGESFYEGELSKSYFAGLCYFLVKQDGLNLVIENKFEDRSRTPIKSTHFARLTYFFPDQNVAEITFDPNTPLNSLDCFYCKLYLYIGTQRISNDFNPYPYFFVAVPLKYQIEKSEAVYNPEIQNLFKDIINLLNGEILNIPSFSFSYNWTNDFERIEIQHIKLNADFIVVKGNLKEINRANSIGQILNFCPITDNSYRPKKHFSLPENMMIADFCKKYKIEFYPFFPLEKQWEWEINMNISRYIVFIESTQIFYPNKNFKKSIHQAQISYYFDDSHVLEISIDQDTTLKKQDELINKLYLSPKENIFYTSFNPFRYHRESFPVKVDYQLVCEQYFDITINLMLSLLQLAYPEKELNYLYSSQLNWEKTIKGRKAVFGSANGIHLLIKEEITGYNQEAITVFSITAQNLRPYEESRLEINSKKMASVVIAFKKDVQKLFYEITKSFPLRDTDKESEEYREFLKELSDRENGGEKLM
jgi:hypothetical protein